MAREIFLATNGRSKRARSLMVHLAAGGEDVELVYTFWVLRDDKETMLIDTGFPERVCAPRGISRFQDPAISLAGINVDPLDVTTVIVSHLHWDHFAAPERFPNATFIVQHEDIAYFTGIGREHPMGHLADAPSLDALATIRAQGRLRVVDGAARLAPDLSVIRVGGHTPGMQITVLESAQGPTVFACDASHLYQNLETRTPTSIIYSYHDYQRGFLMIEDMAAAGRWFPGHDPKLIEGREPAAPGIYRIA